MANEHRILVMLHERLFLVFVDGSCLLLVFVCGGGDVS